MEKVSDVKVMLGDGSILDCVLSFKRVPPWSLRLTGIDLGKNSFVADDLFDAMVLLRKELEFKGAMLLCAGARPEVYPSPMSRGGGGIKVYVTKIGFQATGDLVNIFDYAERESVGTVDQQIEFHRKWADSLRSKITAI